MQLAITVGSAAEARLVAAFMQDFAELIELQRDAVPAPAPEFAPIAEAAAPAKKSRARKEPTPSATTAEALVESGSSETAAPAAEAGNAPAPAATEPAVSSAVPAGNSEDSAASPAASAATEPVTLDQLRVLFGELSQQGKRTPAIAVVRGFKANGLAEIPEDQRGEAYAQLKAL